ncbi:MAG: catalase family protein [Burkholderiales bacterium]
MTRLILTVTTLSAVALMVCGWLSLRFSIPAEAADQAAGKAEKPLQLGQERVSMGEDKVIKELVALQLGIIKANPALRGRRGQHAKHHGCVEAEIVVRGDIPRKFQVGLFKEAKSYKAKVRFSNGGQRDDTQPDAHGMAIKVLGVKGPRALEKDSSEEQDFVLVDSEVFFAPDPKTVLEFMKARVAVESKKDPGAMKRFAERDPRTVARVKDFLKASFPSPLAVQYWSAVPFKLGERAVKYTAKSAPGNGPKDVQSASADYLRIAMVDHLTNGKRTAVFWLYIIPQTDAVKMPVEDPTVRWESNPVSVATIKIKPQNFDTAERTAECEKASFDPWNALAEHRPLGGINRARKAVYPESVKLRQTLLP